jgi:hypothetical protein
MATHSAPTASAGVIPQCEATIVPILGMHRSGTSMFTHALNLLGLTLGEPLMEPQEDNPKGFWENEFFYGVNLRLLHAMGRHVSGYGTGSQLLEVPALSYQVERSGDTLAVIENYVTAQFSSSRFWGWKDPRSVLLFPFWLSSFVELGFCRIRPTVITRHPSSDVSSLARRSDLVALASCLTSSVEELSLQMWTAYSHILLDLVDETNCFVSVHEWYLDPGSARAELARCCDYLGMETADKEMESALQWLDPGAVHHRDPTPLNGLPGADEALLLHEDLVARARAQRARWRLRNAA